MKIPTPEELKVLAERYGLKLIVLFGSQVRGRTHAESDVDEAVLPEKPLSPTRRLELWGALCQAFGADIDLTSLEHAGPLLLYHVARDGKLLYEGEKWAWEKQKSYGYRAYQDARKLFAMTSRYLSRQAERIRQELQDDLEE